MSQAAVSGIFSAEQLQQFKAGAFFQCYEVLGAHITERNGAKGVHFAVWAPHAKTVSLIGDFNNWVEGRHPMNFDEQAGVWELFVPDLKAGARYKFAIMSRYHDYHLVRIDPFAFQREPHPEHVSMVCDLAHEWRDADWMRARPSVQDDRPLSIYELHLETWLATDAGYRECAPQLVAYVQEMGFTHVQLLPIMEYERDESGTQRMTGYFAPTSRLGSPQDFMHLVDVLHQNGIGVLLNWSPARCAADLHGLGMFDGMPLFECEVRVPDHTGARRYQFNLARKEVQSFLLSSARFWLDVYHLDGLHIDSIGQMLYPSFSEKAGHWARSEHISDLNLHAATFLRTLNEQIRQSADGAITTADDASGEPLITWPVHPSGGWGFSYRWDRHFVQHLLDYLRQNASGRQHHFDELSRQPLSAERNLLPLSHDLVAAGRGSLLERMPGDPWQAFANLRLLLGAVYTHPGRKLLFMGCEFAESRAWRYDRKLDWDLTQRRNHAGVQTWIVDLNRLYRSEPALFELDNDAAGFEWVDTHDAAFGTFSFLRRSRQPGHLLLAVCNFTSSARERVLMGVPADGWWREVLNSNAVEYGGNGQGNLGGVRATSRPAHDRPFSLEVVVPPLSICIFRHDEAPAQA